MMNIVFMGNGEEDRGLSDIFNDDALRERYSIQRVMEFPDVSSFLASNFRADLIFIYPKFPEKHLAELMKASEKRMYRKKFVCLLKSREEMETSFFPDEQFLIGCIVSPVNSADIHQVLTKVLTSLQTESLFVKSDSIYYRIIKSSIVYVEAAEKKIKIRTAGQEIEFYGTLEKLENQLGPGFIRCHKGYLVNQNAILTYDVSSYTLKLAGNIDVPVSRSFRNTMKNIVTEEG